MNGGGACVRLHFHFPANKITSQKLLLSLVRLCRKIVTEMSWSASFRRVCLLFVNRVLQGFMHEDALPRMG
jgi:hypothetical protein